MCTLVILRRPGHPWPVLIGANRDEMIDRRSKPPGRHWPDRRELVAGLDLLAGGSWLGVNDWGVAAAVLNRHGSLGPTPDRRSRGELVLEALDHADATVAAEALSYLDPEAYRTFNLIVTDERHGFWLRHAGGPRIERRPLKRGLSMIAAGDLDDLETRRLELALPAFRAWPTPDPDRDDWSGWQSLLGSTRASPNEPVDAAMRFRIDGYGTVSSALIALPARDGADRRPVFRFAEWLPHPSPWRDVMDADRGSQT
ncbi:MAG: NRDE family protein [Alphaproteobacteria bacterium]|nr:NRDE family protein [Alphaproteobacteria bacterium]